MECCKTDLATQETSRPSELQVKPFDQSTSERWDQFVMQQRSASLFHLLAWKRALEKTFGYESCYFYVECGGKITGVLPLFRIRNWLMGDCLISIPFAVYGGVCAQDEQSEGALVRHAQSLGIEHNVDYLELRNRRGGISEGFRPNSRYVTFETELLGDEQLMLKQLPRDTRYMIRKGQKARLVSRRGLDQLTYFYRLFAVSMRRHGTPVFPLTWFIHLIEEFKDQIDLLMVYADGKPVAGVLSFQFRNAMLPYYAGADDCANGMAANNFMYWELMRVSAHAGIRYFDFGRSKKGTGSFAFKMAWNATAQRLDYQVSLVRRKTHPDYSPLNPKFRMGTRLWSRIPLPVTTWIGPRVIRWFP